MLSSALLKSLGTVGTEVAKAPPLLSILYSPQFCMLYESHRIWLCVIPKKKLKPPPQIQSLSTLLLILKKTSGLLCDINPSGSQERRTLSLELWTEEVGGVGSKHTLFFESSEGVAVAMACSSLDLILQWWCVVTL